MEKPVPVVTDSAPKAIGPYTQGITAQGMLFVSGQIPLDPRTGVMVSGALEDEVIRVLENLGAILKTAGSGFDRVLRTTVYMTDLADFEAMNSVYSRYFEKGRPARSTVQVVALPRGARVEIDAIALTG